MVACRQKFGRRHPPPIDQTLLQILPGITGHLEEQGYAALTASDGTTAIEILQREREGISLVLLDVSMPGMSGQRIFQELLKIQPDLDVLISSGYTEAESMRVFAGMPVRGFVQKPYTPKALARQVRAALVSRRSTRFGAA